MKKVKILRELYEKNSGATKNFLGSKLQFYADRTAVHSGENCSFMPIKLFKTQQKIVSSRHRVVHSSAIIIQYTTMEKIIVVKNVFLSSFLRKFVN